MRKNLTVLSLVALLSVVLQASSENEEVYRLRMFFGLSVPGGGAVSLQQWQSFEVDVIATRFDGFNVVDSVGYYKGKAERSKIVTLILSDQDLGKATAVAAQYAKQFKQDSVMVVKIPVQEWNFVRAADL